MPQNPQDIMKSAQLYSDDQDYTLIKMFPSAIMLAAGIVAEIGEPFCALIADKDEVSLIIPKEAVADFSNRLRGSTLATEDYRLITIDTVLEPDVVGLMALVSGALAAANVPILPLAAYSRDHLLVPASAFERAVQALAQLKASL